MFFCFMRSCPSLKLPNVLFTMNNIMQKSFKNALLNWLCKIGKNWLKRPHHWFMRWTLLQINILNISHTHFFPTSPTLAEMHSLKNLYGFNLNNYHTVLYMRSVLFEMSTSATGTSVLFPN